MLLSPNTKPWQQICLPPVIKHHKFLVSFNPQWEEKPSARNDFFQVPSSAPDKSDDSVKIQS